MNVELLSVLAQLGLWYHALWHTAELCCWQQKQIVLAVLCRNLWYPYLITVGGWGCNTRVSPSICVSSLKIIQLLKEKTRLFVSHWYDCHPAIVKVVQTELKSKTCSSSGKCGTTQLFLYCFVTFWRLKSRVKDVIMQTSFFRCNSVTSFCFFNRRSQYYCYAGCASHGRFSC